MSPEKWKEICFILSKSVSPKMSEKDFENQVVRWGRHDDPDAYQDPVVWSLSEGNHLLYLRQRESGSRIESLTMRRKASVALQLGRDYEMVFQPDGSILYTLDNNE